MADRATAEFGSINDILQGAPQTYIIEYEPAMADLPVYSSYTGSAVGLSRVAQAHGGDFCNPPTDIRYPDNVYITNGPADPHHVHPGVRGDGLYQTSNGGVTITLDGIEIVQPRYNLIDVQSYLVGNAWHYAAVKAKAIAATELGYEWRYEKRSRRGILQQATKDLSSFEDRIYARNHKDLATLLRDQAFDYFSTGNKTMEIAYNMGGKVDSIYAVPAITVFRHPWYPIAIQAIPQWESWWSILPFDGQRESGGLQVRAILPLFMSGLSRADLYQMFPNVDPALFTDNEMVHVTNSLISTDPFYGVADILPALSAMFGDNAANDYNWQFFENNAVPRYAVTVTGGRVDKEVSKSIVDFFNREIQGRNHRTIVIPLPRDMTANFQALDATQNEASFIQFKKLNREEIAAAHSIPPSEIGLWENANKANASQQAKNYFLKVIRPYQAKDEAMMNRILEHGLGITDVKFKFKNVEYTDDQERAAVAMTKAQSYKYYLDGIANVIKTVQGLANGQAAGGGSGGGGFGWRNQAIGLKQQADDTSKTSETDTAPVKQVPLLSEDEAKAIVKELVDQIWEGRSLFELEGHIDTDYD